MSAIPMRPLPIFLPLPRNPLLRGLVFAVVAVVSIGLLALAFVFGIVILVAAALWIAFHRWRAGRMGRSADPSIIEGEFTEVRPRTLTRSPRNE